MLDKEYEDMWINYGLIARLPLKEVKAIKSFLEENNIKLVYDKVSIGHLLIKEKYPSGSLNPEGTDDTE